MSPVTNPPPPPLTLFNTDLHYLPNTTPTEIGVLAEKIASEHHREVLNIASLVHLTRCAFEAYGGAADIDLKPVLDLQRKYLQSHMLMHNISMTAVLSAVASLERAEGTVKYLDSLPN